MTTTHAPGVAAEVIAVRPGPPLAGTVSVDGSKNAALPLLAAAAAFGHPVPIEQRPGQHGRPNHACSAATGGLACRAARR